MSTYSARGGDILHVPHLQQLRQLLHQVGLQCSSSWYSWGGPGACSESFNQQTQAQLALIELLCEALSPAWSANTACPML